MEIRDVKTDKNQICELILCEKTEDAEFHKNSCLERKCISCGTDIIDTHYAKLIEKSKEDTKSIEYHKWEYISVQKEDDITKHIYHVFPKPQHLRTSCWNSKMIYKIIVCTNSGQLGSISR